MADAADPVLLQLLIKFQMRLLDRVNATVKKASDFDAVLRRAALHTPRDVLQNSDQLDSLLLKDLTEREIGCLRLAAIDVTGAPLF